ncbi:MAG: nitrilase-related carbon-nitrogen hydrolase [Methanoregula sp.]|uniref:nitrilase-related carbon-nitrogen hydrolase n=1 Tax=Methanoregula sp. TaxID=2052170 RepID=UPI003BAFB786
MLCCSAQICGVWESPKKTLEAAEDIFDNASKCGAALISFPEQFATCWDPVSTKNIEDITGPTVTGLCRMAKKYSVGVVGSFRETCIPKPKNTAIAIDRNGEILAKYSKIHLFTPGHEDYAFTPGTGLAPFTFEGVRFGLAICYDLRFPEIFRLYRREGVDAIIVPAAWPESRLHHWELFIRARAAENQMYIVGVDATGNTPVDSYAGMSITADPYGTIIARAGKENELLYYEIDPCIVENARRDFPVHNDNKEALYASLHRKDTR